MSPAFDQDLGLEQRIEELAIEKLGAKFPVEGFDIAILPRASGLDEEGAHADLTQPLSNRSSREFRPVVRTDIRFFSPSRLGVSRTGKPNETSPRLLP